jgi:hypothetical protein
MFDIQFGVELGVLVFAGATTQSYICAREWETYSEDITSVGEAPIG